MLVTGLLSMSTPLNVLLHYSLDQIYEALYKLVSTTVSLCSSWAIILVISAT